MRHQDNTGKFIAFILRHHPESIGMKLDEHGWARTEDLIAGIAKSRPFDMQMLEEIVRTDSKQRYSFNEDKTLIRANQGHSIRVDVELEQKTPSDVLWHGTGEKYVESINKFEEDQKCLTMAEGLIALDNAKLYFGNPDCMCICQKIMRLPKQSGADMESRLYTR